MSVQALFVKSREAPRPFERTTGEGQLFCAKEGFDGDKNPLTSEDRSVLLQSVEHYAAIQSALEAHASDPRLQGRLAGSGENLLVSGVDRDTICLGDIWHFGGLRLEVTCPRKPCKRWTHTYKSDPTDGIRVFVMQNAYAGWFCRVLQEGYIGPGDVMELETRPYPQWTMNRLNHLLYGHSVVEDDSPAKPVWIGTEEEFEELLSMKCLGAREWKDVLEDMVEEAEEEEAEAEAEASSLHIIDSVRSVL